MKTFALWKKIALFGGFITVSAVALVLATVTTPAAAASCVKGDKATDFTGTIVSKDTMSIVTKSGGKLCDDVKVNFSSFKLPLTYNGKGFSNNPTAIPQYLYANKTVTLKKGTTGKTTVTVSVPDECTPHQIDAYLGEVRTSIETSEGLKGKRIVGEIFNKTKDDCSEPVKVCDTKTGTIVTVTKKQAEANPDRYVDKDSDKCKVKACDTSTGTIVMVEKGKENTSPYTTDLDKCEKVTVCDTKTGTIVTITKDVAQSDTNRYVDKDSDKCKVSTCDTSTGTIVKIEKGKENTPPYSTNLDKCEKVTVCDTKTGTVVSVTKDVAQSDTSRYVDQNSEKCKEPEIPAEVPSTGPAEIISGIAGIGSVAGAGSMYIKSRRVLRKY